MSEMNAKHNANMAQVARVRVAIKGYAGEDHDLEANIKDVLCDLRHLCAAKGLDFDRLNDIANQNFLAEDIPPLPELTKDELVDDDVRTLKALKLVQSMRNEALLGVPDSPRLMAVLVKHLGATSKEWVMARVADELHERGLIDYQTHQKLSVF